MHTYLYIHGYGSTGNAHKAQLLQKMFPTSKVITPTINYDTENPYDVLNQLKDICEKEHVEMIVGSSMGGYFALCCSTFFDGPIWAINPVRNIMHVIHQLAMPCNKLTKEHAAEIDKFDNEVFKKLHPKPKQFNFALSTDDELLGDHAPLLEMFPDHNYVVCLDNCGHAFTRFWELKPSLTL